MLPQLLLNMLLAAALAGAPQNPASPNLPAQQEAPSKQSQPASQTQSSAQPQAPSAPATAKPNPKHRKVYTEDDLKGGGISFGGDELDVGQVNDCDRNCFIRVRQGARTYGTNDASWRRDVLASLDAVRKDAGWQAFLTELYRVRLKYCRLASEKNSELAKVADPANVTEREVGVEEKYELKYKTLQAATLDLYRRESAMQQKYGPNSYAAAFMNIQVSRIQSAPCPPDRQEAYGSDPDDPSDP